MLPTNGKPDSRIKKPVSPLIPEMYQMKKLPSLESLLLVVFLSAFSIYPALAEDPKQGDSKKLDLGKDVSLEVVYIPPGKFTMGSTAAEKEWATGIEGGAKPGTVRVQLEKQLQDIINT